MSSAEPKRAVVHALPSATMVSMKEEGCKVVQVISAGPRSECDAIIRHIHRLTQEGPAERRLAYGDIAVLGRTRAIVRRMRTACREAKPPIPVQGQKNAQKQKKVARRRSARQSAADSDDSDATGDDKGGGSGSSPVLRRPLATVNQWLASNAWQSALAFSNLLLAHHAHRVQLCGLPVGAVAVDPSAVTSSLRFLLEQMSNAHSAADIMEGLQYAEHLTSERWERAGPVKRRRMDNSMSAYPSVDQPQSCLYHLACVGLMDVREDADDDAVEHWARLASAFRQKVRGIGVLRLLLSRVRRLYEDCINSVHLVREGADVGRLQLILAPILNATSDDIDFTPSPSLSASPTSSPSFSSSAKANSESSALEALRLITHNQPRIHPLPCPQHSAVHPCDPAHCSRWGSCLTALHFFLHLVDNRQIDLLCPQPQRSDGVVSGHAPSSQQRAEASSAAVEAVRGVFVSTIHQAKGLEWKAVLVVSCNEGVLPLHDNGLLDYREAMRLNRREEVAQEREVLGLSAGGDGAEHEEVEEEEEEADELLLDPLREECRLAYVAVTRARERLFLSWTLTDDDGFPLQPSRFLVNLPTDVVEREGTTGAAEQGEVGKESLRPPLTELVREDGRSKGWHNGRGGGEVKKMRVQIASEGKGGGSVGASDGNESGMFRRASEWLQARPLSSRSSRC